MTNPFPDQSSGQQPVVAPGVVPQNVPSRAQLRAQRAGQTPQGSARQGQPVPSQVPQQQAQPTSPRSPQAQPATARPKPAQPVQQGAPVLSWVSPTGKTPTSGVSPFDSIAPQTRTGASGGQGGNGGSGRGGSGGGSGNGKGRSPQRKKKQVRALLAIVVSLAIVALGANFVMGQLRGDSTEVATGPTADYPGPGEGSVVITIPEGATGAEMGRILTDNDVVSGSEVFVQAFNANPNAVGIRPGTYEMQQQMNSNDAVALLIAATSRLDRTVTIPEGQTVAQIVTQLSNTLGIPEQEFYDALADPESIGLPEQAGGEAEGWLAPLTYPFPPDTTATQALTRMIRPTVTMLSGYGVPEEEWQEVLIKASLIEREARLDEDRPKVARSIENRLDRDMVLQIDASLAYGLRKSGMDLSTADKSIENPFNLELNKGLPPTPIASPSTKSVEAVLEPADGPWIFWVTVNLDTGETKFSETYAEHQVFVAELRQWQRDNGLRD